MNCKNCQFQLNESDDYCPNCGAKVIRNRLTIKNLFEHFSEQFLNYDNKFLQTFLHLFTKPEIVIQSYIDGTRKKYVNVISYFAIAITVSGLYLFILNKFFPECLELPDFMPSGQEEFQSNGMAFMQEYQSLLMMLYIPLYAIMAKMVFIGFKKYNYTELFVIFMYTQSQLSIVLAVLILLGALLGLNFYIMSFISMPIMIFYTAFCLYRLYKLNVQEMILRTLMFFIVMAIFFVIYVLVIFGIMILNGDFQEMIEAQKAAKEASGS